MRWVPQWWNKQRVLGIRRKERLFPRRGQRTAELTRGGASETGRRALQTEGPEGVNLEAGKQVSPQETGGTRWPAEASGGRHGKRWTESWERLSACTENLMPFLIDTREPVTISSLNNTLRECAGSFHVSSLPRPLHSSSQAPPLHLANYSSSWRHSWTTSERPSVTEHALPSPGPARLSLCTSASCHRCVLSIGACSEEGSGNRGSNWKWRETWNLEISKENLKSRCF